MPMRFRRPQPLRVFSLQERVRPPLMWARSYERTREREHLLDEVAQLRVEVEQLRTEVEKRRQVEEELRQAKIGGHL